jgi:hypothetical protein
MSDGDAFGEEPTKPGIPVPTGRRSESTQAMYTYQLGQEALCASARAWRPLPPDHPEPDATLFRKTVADWLGNAMQIGQDMRDPEVLRWRQRATDAEDLLVQRESEIHALKAQAILDAAQITRLRAAAQGKDPRSL